MFSVHNSPLGGGINYKTSRGNKSTTHMEGKKHALDLCNSAESCIELVHFKGKKHGDKK